MMGWRSPPSGDRAGALTPLAGTSSGPLGLRCSLTTTEAITAACTKMATAAAIADRASVRGVRLHRNSEMRLPEVVPAAVARRPRLLGIDCGEQPLDRARRWRTECLIQVDRLDKLLADQFILPRQFAV